MKNAATSIAANPIDLFTTLMVAHLRKTVQKTSAIRIGVTVANDAPERGDKWSRRVTLVDMPRRNYRNSRTGANVTTTIRRRPNRVRRNRVPTFRSARGTFGDQHRPAADSDFG